MIRYSVQPRNGIFIKGYGFLTFVKNMGKNISKNLRGKYSQKPLNHAKKSATYILKNSSKPVIQKTATGDLTGNKIPQKITKLSKHLQ